MTLAARIHELEESFRAYYPLCGARRGKLATTVGTTPGMTDDGDGLLGDEGDEDDAIDHDDDEDEDAFEDDDGNDPGEEVHP